MNGPWFVETLARNGDVLHRHQLQQLPIRLGRGYANDYILDDDYAAANHAVIEADELGRLVLRDMGTHNGVIHQGKRMTSLVIDGDTVIRLGHTSLRVRSADFPVAPELVDRTMHGWEGRLPGLVGLLLISLFILVTTWLGDTQSFQLVRYLRVLAFALAGGLMWGGVWAFVNRLFGRHTRLGRHLFVLGSGLFAMLVFKVVSSLLAYAFALEGLTRFSTQVMMLFGAGVLYFHLHTVKPQNARRFARISALCGVLLVALTLISNEQRTGRYGDDLYMALILPPAMRVSPNHTIDEFVGDVNAMKARLDAERSRKVKDDGDDD